MLVTDKKHGSQKKLFVSLHMVTKKKLWIVSFKNGMMFWGAT